MIEQMRSTIVMSLHSGFAKLIFDATVYSFHILLTLIDIQIEAKTNVIKAENHRRKQKESDTHREREKL